VRLEDCDPYYPCNGFCMAHVSNASFFRNIGKEIGSSESKSLKLLFANNLSLPVFTGARIEGEEGPVLKVVLMDTLTGKIVNSGPESSSRVEIVVLEGDFDGDEGENWTPEEFKTNIVREREGKKPLLTGDVLLNLKEGICLVGEISFTDNSSWTRSRKFRLGVRAVDNFDGTSIRESKTESFIVRDHRGECEFVCAFVFGIPLLFSSEAQTMKLKWCQTNFRLRFSV